MARPQEPPPESPTQSPPESPTESSIAPPIRSPTGTVVTFGEVLLRLEPAAGTRLTHIADCRVHVGGSEANVATHLARWHGSRAGKASKLVTSLPNNPLGDRALEFYRRAGVDVSAVARTAGRMGLYFTEPGAGPRPTRVLYDRADSAFARLAPKAIDWSAALDGAHALHLSGITPALGPGPLAAARQALATAADHGVPVSFDLNYRAALWSPADAVDSISPLLSSVDLLIAPSGQVAEVLGIEAGTDENGLLTQARTTAERYGSRRVALTVRDGDSADRGGFGAALYDAERHTFALGPRHEVPFVDRVGSGDAFAAGLLFADQQGQGDEEALAFACAAAALAHTVVGDAGPVYRDEIERLAAGTDGRIRR